MSGLFCGRLAVAAATVALLLSTGQAPAQVVAPLSNAPFAGNPTAAAIAEARSAIAAASAAAASRAQYAYRDALLRYRSGDLAGARRSAVDALTLAAEPAPGAGTIAPLVPLGRSSAYGAPPTLGTAAGPGSAGLGAQIFPSTALGTASVGGALQVDEDELVAKSRSALASCIARKPDQLSAARAEFATVWSAYARHDVFAERLAARTIVTHCGVLF